jgi:hypothetical protein
MELEKRFLVKRKGEMVWLPAKELTEPELVKEYEKLNRRRKGGVNDVKFLVAERELERRAANSMEVGLC